MKPGRIALARTLRWPYSSAAPRTSCSMAALTRPVRTEEGVHQTARDRGHADERTVTGLDQMRNRVLEAQEGADRVQVQDADEFRGVLLADGGEPAAAARVGDAAGQPAGGLRGERDRLLDRSLFGDVRNDLTDRPGTCRADPGLGLDALDGLGELGFGTTTDRDVGAISDQARGASPADTGSATGHQDGVRGEVCSLRVGVRHSARLACGVVDLVDRLEAAEQIQQLVARYPVAYGRPLTSIPSREFGPLTCANPKWPSSARDCRRRRTFHLVAAPALNFTGDDLAHGQAVLRAEAERGEQWVVVGGVYDDTYVRRDGTWYLGKRTFTVAYSGDVLSQPS